MSNQPIVYLKKQKSRSILVWCLLLTIPAVLMLLMENRVMGELGHQTPDAKLYLSIADNYVNTGHFIQTVRNVDGMVVPPGTPFMLTIFRILRFSNRMIMCVQMFMFGVSNILLYETEKRINGKGIWAPIIYTMANLRCWIILGDAIVEHYYLFLLCLEIWIMYNEEISSGKKVVYMNITGLSLLMVRPVLSLVYVPVFGYTLYWAFKNKKIGISIFIILLPIMILGMNVAVNYKETGELVILENYSGSDMYIASRSDAPVMIEESIGFMDETYLSIIQDPSLTMQQCNRLFKKLAKENLKNHFGLYLLNGLRRGHEIFLKAYAWATVYTLLGGILLARKEQKERKMRSTVILVITVLLAIISSFGVSEVRYSIVIWPMAAIHGAYLTHIIMRYVFERMHQASQL